MAATRTRQQSQQRSQKEPTRTKQIKTPLPKETKNFIVNLLKKEGSLTRGDITTRTGIPRTTVYDTLVNLLLTGIIEKYIERNGRRGRPSVYYQLVAE